MAIGLKYSSYFLYVGFHRSLNQNPIELLEELQEICPLVTNVRRPRQGDAHFCFVHFDSEMDQIQGKKIFENLVINSRKVIVKMPQDKNSEEYKQKRERLEQRRLAKKSARRMKNKAKKLVLIKKPN